MKPGTNDVADWWTTDIIDMAPGQIRLRGHPVESLIGQLSFTQMIWLMTRGDIPTDDQAELLEHALVAAVDHGPQAPSIATARMAVTCGAGINNALASAVNMLDDVHGGAGEQTIELYHQISRRDEQTGQFTAAIEQSIDEWQRERSRYIPGFGHRFHQPEDPRAPRLMELVADAATQGTVTGYFRKVGMAVQQSLSNRRGKPLPMNIDGATAVIYAELGFAGPLARGLFCLSRSVGIISHAWEQMQQGGRNKGPTPPTYRWTYNGENPIVDNK